MKSSTKSKAGSLAILGMLAAPVLASSLNVYADTNTIPAYLTQAATTMDVSVTDSVDFTLAADSNTATLSSVTVTNNLHSVPVVVSNIQATAETGYNLEAYNTDFTSFSVNSKHFGIAYTRTNENDADISGTGYAMAEEIAAEGNHEFTFAGKSSVYSTAVTAASNTQMANIIFTIAMKPVVPQLSDYVTYMQDFATLSSADKATVLSLMEDNTIYDLIDNRDNKTYQVAKMKDGKIWMAENLDLGATPLSTNLTSANTNLSQTVTASTFNTWVKQTTSSTFTGKVIYSVPGIDDTSGTPYGSLYNYCAASAGTTCAAEGKNNMNASYDICPAGWRLPTGKSNGEFGALITEYNTSTLMRTPIANGGFGVPITGSFNEWTEGGIEVPAGSSGFWSSTVYETGGSGMYVLSIDKSGYLGPRAGGAVNRNSGLSIRCIVK